MDFVNRRSDRVVTAILSGDRYGFIRAKPSSSPNSTDIIIDPPIQIPDEHDCFIEVQDMRLNNAISNISQHMQNNKLLFHKADGLIVTIVIPDGLYSNQQALIEAINEIEPGALTYSYTANGRLRLSSNRYTRMYLPLGNFDISETTFPFYHGHSFYSDEEQPRYVYESPAQTWEEHCRIVQYEDFVLDSLAVKFGISNAQFFALQQNHMWDVPTEHAGRIVDAYKRHVIGSIQLPFTAPTVGDIIGSCAQLLVRCPDVESLNGSEAFLAQISCASWKIGSDIIVGKQAPVCLKRNVRYINHLSIVIIDSFGRPVTILTGYPSITIAIRVIRRI